MALLGLFATTSLAILIKGYLTTHTYCLGRGGLTMIALGGPVVTPSLGARGGTKLGLEPSETPNSKALSAILKSGVE